MHTCFVLQPCEITNLIYFFFVLGGHYPLFLEVDADEKEKMFTIISSLEHFTIQVPNNLDTEDHCIHYEKITLDCFVNWNV